MPPVSGVGTNNQKKLPTTQLLFSNLETTGRYLQATNWGLHDLSASSTVVSHPATLATALYSVFWDLCKCPSDNSDNSDNSNFAAVAFSFAQPLLFWPAAWPSQMGRITVIPAWYQVGDIDSHQVLHIGLLVGIYDRLS